MFNIYSGDCIYRILEHKYCVNYFIQFNDGRVLSGASDGVIKEYKWNNYYKYKKKIGRKKWNQ